MRVELSCSAYPTSKCGRTFMGRFVRCSSKCAKKCTDGQKEASLLRLFISRYILGLWEYDSIQGREIAMVFFLASMFTASLLVCKASSIIIRLMYIHIYVYTYPHVLHMCNTYYV